MNRKAVVKTESLILAVTILICMMTGCNMKDTQSTETITEKELVTDAAQDSISPAADASEMPQMQPLPYDGNYPQHEPYGIGIGAVPGRVVWSHNPDSVE